MPNPKRTKSLTLGRVGGNSRRVRRNPTLSQQQGSALPAFFIPFPGAGNYAKDHPWKDWDPEYFIPAWDRMFNIFERQGANTHLVWGLHLAGQSAGFLKKRKYFLFLVTLKV